MVFLAFSSGCGFFRWSLCYMCRTQCRFVSSLYVLCEWYVFFGAMYLGWRWSRGGFYVCMRGLLLGGVWRVVTCQYWCGAFVVGRVCLLGPLCSFLVVVSFSLYNDVVSISLSFLSGGVFSEVFSVCSVILFGGRDLMSRKGVSLTGVFAGFSSSLVLGALADYLLCLCGAWGSSSCSLFVVKFGRHGGTIAFARLRRGVGSMVMFKIIFVGVLLVSLVSL